MIKQLALLLFFLITSRALIGQTVSGKLRLEEGKTLNIEMEMKASVAQQASGQAIDFTTDAFAVHHYKVTNATATNFTLHHAIKKITFNFDGMGQQRSFDSDRQQDMEGAHGGTVKDILGKKFDITIDPAGKTLGVRPEKTDSIQADERLALVFTMLKDITNVVYPPKKGEASFFKVLPDKPINKGDTWTDSIANQNEKYSTTYTLSDITDSTLVIDFKGNSSTITKAMMMGMPTTTNMNSTLTGKIIVDKLTGIMKEKTIVTESNGNTEAMGGNLPVTSKTTIRIIVKPEQ